MALNHITVMGRLTDEPSLRTTQNGVNVATFTVAVDRDYSSGGEKQTDFFEVSVWRQTAEFVTRYFHKGSMIVVSGKMQSRKYQDRDGKNRVAWGIQAENVYFGESKKDNGVKVANAPEEVQVEEVEDDGDLPF